MPGTSSCPASPLGPSVAERVSLRTRGLTFDVHIGGPADGPPVLLLHGFPQNANEWAQVAEDLRARGARTIAPDLRGYSPGARPRAVSAYRAAELAADVVGMLDVLDIRRAHLVGHDWGALTAWYVAGSAADRVKSLTALSVPHPQAFARAVRTDPDQQERSAYFALFRQPGVAEETLLADDALGLRAFFHGSTMSPAVLDGYVAPLRAPSALTAALNYYRAMSLTDPTALGPIDLPVTFVWSDDDMAIGRVAAEGCAEFCTSEYRYVELAGVSHWVVDDSPLDVLDAAAHRIGL
jgi:pimeloyl-ACP methyl ester carboxylesterase